MYLINLHRYTYCTTKHSSHYKQTNKQTNKQNRRENKETGDIVVTSLALRHVDGQNFDNVDIIHNTNQ